MTHSETGMSQYSPDMSPVIQRSGGPRSRTQSISSDRPSTVAQSAMTPPTSVSPEATFIAASAASQIVTNEHDGYADTWYDQHGLQQSGDPVLVSFAALQHLNNFLDHLLFNFLAQSGSTTLPALRPAVTEVLKPKLAKDAINNADEELREYLGGGDDEEFLQSRPAPPPRDWDLELVWKRTRLRCMVYSSLGDMEEEEEDRHMEDGLLADDDENLGGSVSPAVAIFLTSILEFLGEQALISAGQAAWNRMRVRYEKEQKDGVRGRADLVDRIVVEEVDMERVALDRTLGRLWRAWKKRIRSPGPSTLDTREKMHQFRRGSAAAESAVPPPVQEHITESAIAKAGIAQEEETTAEPDDVQAAAIPLPSSDGDTDKTDTPGLAHYSDHDTEEEEPKELDSYTRPKSLMHLPVTGKTDLPTSTISQLRLQTDAPRKRSNSLPTPAVSPSVLKKVTVVVANAIEQPQATDQSLPKQPAEELVKEKSLAPETAEVQNAEPGHVISEAKPPIQKRSARHQSEGIVPKIVGAGAGSATASAKRNTDHDGDADDSDFEVEEAQILTSSRISIGTSLSGRSASGRSISPANSDRSSRPPLSIQTIPIRSNSLRLVDVSSPRTPSNRSQRSWIQEQSNSSYSRSGDVSRASSVRTQPNLEEPRSAEESRAVSGTNTLGKSRTGVIHEAEENADASVWKPSSPLASAVVTSRTESPRLRNSQATAAEKRFEPQNAAHWQGTPPASGTILSSHSYLAKGLDQSRQQQSQEVNSPGSGAVLEDELAPLPQKQQRRSPRQFGPQSGTPSSPIAEETTRRQFQETFQSGIPQRGTIGIVSVDRSGMSKEPGDATSPSRDQNTDRQLHTSGSSSTSSHKVRATRGSQDSTATRSGDVVRNFEDLIQSNETIQYTLTPDNMRELEGSPKTIPSGVSIKGRKSEDARQFSRERSGSAVTNKTAELKRSASITRSSPLNSHPVERSTSEATIASPSRSPPAPMANRVRGTTPQARDARVPQESIVEFAEFIRATGPPGVDAEPRVPLRRNLSMMTKRSAPTPRVKMSLDYGRQPMTGSIGRARLEARDATVDTANDKSDLIDFIRRGPPSAENPHIPRAVAPFRTTMDSDQLVSAVGGKAMDAILPDIHDTRYSQASTNITDQSAPSVQSSINSQSALLARTQMPGQNSTPFEEEDMMPQRKQRRVRDPYAIDLSDEEEDDDFDFQPQPSRKIQQPREESLMDFLNSEPPPPPSAPVPFNLPRTPAQSTPAPKKKASAASLMSRFRQNSSGGNSNGSRNPTSPPRSQRMFESRSQSSRAGAGTSNAIKGYVPIQVNIPTGGDLFPTYDSTSTAPPIPKEPSSMPSSRPSGRVPMKKFEPRDAVPIPSRGTSDLADFLRSSSPPPSMAPSFPPGPTESNGGYRFFGRRKKSTGLA